MKECLGIALLILCGVIPVLAQSKDVDGTYLLKGTVQTHNNLRIPGLILEFRDGDIGDKAVSDINGLFEIRLRNGKYVVAAPDIPESQFRAFINIDSARMNPQDVVFAIDEEGICFSNVDGKSMPAIVRSAIPIYPAAAKAVRATGRVIVEAKVDKDGKVLGANALMGHPLLRKSSELALGRFLFQTSNSSDERSVIVLFIFGIESGNPVRLECPYRIAVIAAREIF